MTRELKFGDLDYLTEVDIETLATIFACATAMIGLDMFKGDKMRAQVSWTALIAALGSHCSLRSRSYRARRCRKGLSYLLSDLLARRTSCFNHVEAKVLGELKRIGFAFAIALD